MKAAFEAPQQQPTQQRRVSGPRGQEWKRPGPSGALGVHHHSSPSLLSLCPLPRSPVEAFSTRAPSRYRVP
uniref:Uncharacterized protein n=1 Tax=Knipowitschia caucasica TaxID=637954 RepID=A0AAV2LEY8_KNICA